MATDPSIWIRLYSSLGYLVVAAVCLAAGYLQGHPTSIETSDELYAALFLVSILPYLIARQSLLENPRPQAIQHDYTIFLVCGVSFLLIVAGAWLSHDVYRELQPGRWKAMMELFDENSTKVLLLAAGSFYLNAVVSALWLWRNNDGQAHRFSNKVLFPAIFTCLLSYVVGYALAGPQLNTALVHFAVIYAVVFYGLTIGARLPMGVFFTLQMGTMIYLFVMVYFGGHESLARPLVSGMIVALAMGVAETGKRALAREGETYIPLAERKHYLRSGINWSSIVCPLLLPLFPLVTQTLPVWPFLLFAGGQCLHWFIRRDEAKSELECLLIGYALPGVLILVGIAQFFGHLPANSGWLDWLSNYEGLLAIVGLMMAGAASVVVFVGRPILEHGFDWWSEGGDRRPFLTLSARFRLLQGTLALVAGGADLVAMVAATSKNPGPLRDAVAINLFCVIIFFIVVINGRKRGILEEMKRMPEKPGRKTDLDQSSSEWRGFVTTVRPTTSLIPGVIVTLGLAWGAKVGWGVAASHGLAYVFVTMFGFVTNDIYDCEKDRCAGRARPIAQGIVGVRKAAWLAGGLATLALILPCYGFDGPSYAVLLGALGLAWGYSWLSRHWPLVKGFWTAVLAVSPLVFLNSTLR